MFDFPSFTIWSLWIILVQLIVFIVIESHLPPLKSQGIAL